MRVLAGLLVVVASLAGPATAEEVLGPVCKYGVTDTGTR